MLTAKQRHDRVHIECPLTREPITISLAARQTARAKTPKEMDEWEVTLTTSYPGAMVRALNKQADDLRKLLRHTGIDADHFADWRMSLEG